MSACFKCRLYTDTVTPVPIREDLKVLVLGLPSDLTEVEARKICRVIMVLSNKPPA